MTRSRSRTWFLLLTAFAVAASAVQVAASAQPARGGPLAPSGLRAAGQATLVGDAHPTLSWVVNDSGRGEAQTAYQVRVGGVWDSGKVISADSVDVAYGGPALRSDHTYTWTVRTWNREGHPSPWSAPARFDVGLLASSDWSAWWLQVDDGALVRGDFDVTKPVARARLYFGAQGLVEPHLNGKRIAPDEVLDSSVTDYASRVLYRGLDVTAQLHRGRNALAFMAGKGQFSGRPTFVAQLDITYAGGSTATFGTDPSWRTTAGPVTGDDFYYGETYDARKEISDWDAAGFDDSAWPPAHAVAPAAHPQSLAQGKAVTALDTTTCCGWAPGELVDGLDGSTDASEGYHSAIESSPDATKWVQVDLGTAQDIAAVRLFPARPTNDTSGDIIAAGFPLRYKVEVSDDPTFATATTVADRTGADQPGPGTSPVELPADATARYVRVTATRLYCNGAGCNFRLAELGVYGADPATTFGLTQLLADPSPPTRVVQTVKPVKQLSPGVYDFGQNYTGSVSVRAAAPAGTTVDIKKGELLDASGQVTTSNISFSAADPPRQTDHYTFRGKGSESYAPHFNYSGFRYAQLTGLPAGTKVKVSAQVEHTDVATTGRFRTSDPLLNTIQDAVAQTQLNDLQNMPVDCPTREKHGWLGDAGDTDPEAMANFDMQSLYTKWLGDIVTSLNPDGSIPSVAPTNGSSYFTDPAWATAYPQVIWDSYVTYGSTRPISTNYAHVKRWVDYLGTISDGDHIVVRSPGSWGNDWLSTVSTPHQYFQTGFYYLDASLLAKMAGVLGNTADAARYHALAGDVAAGFNRRYFDAGTDTYGTGTQLSYAMPLVLGIVPAGHEQGVLGKLVADITAHGDHVTTGFVGTTFVFQALGRYHRNDIALAVAQRTDYPSFGYMVSQGPGTIWEKWPNSSAPDGTSSKDHIGLGGAIGQWFYEQLAGIQPGSDGYRTFTLAPAVVGDLTHASGSQQTVRGAIESSWHRDGAALTYHARVPVGTTATIQLPLLGGARSTVREGGRTIYAGGPGASDPGVSVGAATDDALTLTAKSGDYTFTVLPPSAPFTRLSVSTAGTATIPPGAGGDVTALIEERSTLGGSAAVDVTAPQGWTAAVSPAQVALTPAISATLATVHVAVPSSAASGTYPVTIRVRAPDGTTAGAAVQVSVFRTVPLYDFEAGTQGWQAGDNVTGVAAVTSFANGPRTPHGGAKSLEATVPSVDASLWRTVSVTPAQPLDLSAATTFSTWIDSWGGLPGVTGYQARIVLRSGDQTLAKTVPISSDSWNDVVVDVSSWAYRNSVTSVEVGFSAVGSTTAWGGRFQLDDITWTDRS